jgi:hypothetical protein
MKKLFTILAMTIGISLIAPQAQARDHHHHRHHHHNHDWHRPVRVYSYHEYRGYDYDDGPRWGYYQPDNYYGYRHYRHGRPLISFAFSF